MHAEIMMWGLMQIGNPLAFWHFIETYFFFFFSFFFSEVTSVVKIHEVYLAYHIKFSFFRFGRTDDQFLKVLQNLRINLGLSRFGNSRINFTRLEAIRDWFWK